jgi:hypothetical protein
MESSLGDEKAGVGKARFTSGFAISTLECYPNIAVKSSLVFNDLACYV